MSLAGTRATVNTAEEFGAILAVAQSAGLPVRIATRVVGPRYTHRTAYPAKRVVRFAAGRRGNDVVMDDRTRIRVRDIVGVTVEADEGSAGNG